MRKNRIRLTEADLHRIVENSVKIVLNEMEDFKYDISDYRDIGSTSNIRYFSEIQDCYKQLNAIINSNKSNWDFLHMENWDDFIRELKDAARRMKFYSQDYVSPEDKVKIEQFIKDVDRIPYPDLSVSSNTSFVEKAESVKKIIKIAYNLFDDFINYFLSKHDSGDMKQQDIDADWAKFDKTRLQRDANNKSRGEADQFLRNFNPYSLNMGNPLSRYNRAMEKLGK